MESLGQTGSRSSALAIRARSLIEAKKRLEEKRIETATFKENLKSGGEADDTCASV